MNIIWLKTKVYLNKFDNRYRESFLESRILSNNRDSYLVDINIIGIIE